MLRANQFWFKFILLMLVPLQQIAIDIYLPSLPNLTHLLNASDAEVQMTLALYLLGLGVGQGVYGPLSDRYGRKPMVLFGLGLFCCASLACALSPTIYLLLFARIIQGFAIGCGFVTASAIMSDCYEGHRLNHMSALSSTAFGLAPIIAPVIGGYLQTYLNWQANFYLLFIYGLILFFLFLCFFPETSHHQGQKFSLKPYFELLRSRILIASMICMMMTFTLLIVFNLLGPFILENQFNLTPIQYGHVALFIGLAYLLGTTLNHTLLKYYSLSFLIRSGISLMLLGSLGLVFSLVFHFVSAKVIIIFISLSIFGTGFVFPNSYAKALAVSPRQAGVASAIMGISALSFIFLFSALISHIPLSALVRLVASFLLITFICCLAIRKYPP